MRYGHFDDAAKEYVITRADTPRSWINYLGDTNYGAVITNNAGGYSFYKSGAQGRFMRLRFNAVPMDQPGRYFYLRDQESGDYWSASWQPVGKPLDQFKTRTRHGTAYTIIESGYKGIDTQATYFCPLGKRYECWVLSVTNSGDQPRKLSAFSFAELASEWDTTLDQVNLQYTQYLVECKVVGGIISHSFNTYMPDDAKGFRSGLHRSTFAGLVGAAAAGYDCDRDKFIGPHRGYGNPLAVERGRCGGSEAYGDNGCASYQVDMDLFPGETKRFMVVMGMGPAASAGRAALAEMGSVEQAMVELEKLKAHWHGRLGALTVKTPDGAFDSMINVWNAYNALITFNWARAASLVYNGERDGLGYRDAVQDILGAAAAVPEETKARLELMMTGQCASGGALPVVQAFNHHPGSHVAPTEAQYRADDCLWLFNAVEAVVNETGDVGFYDKVLPFADQGEATVLGHLRRAIEFNLHYRGAHGLPCGLSADWNDCLELGRHGESMFVAFQLRLALATYIDICGRLKRDEEAAWARPVLEELDAAINEHGWDGQWYRRAFMASGAMIGSKDVPEGSIYLNTQSWAVIAGAGDERQRRSAMDAAHEHLATPYGLVLCDPPYTATPRKLGEVRSVLYLAGAKENGGIFNHTQGWAVMAEAMLGRGDRAYEYYRAFMPAAYNDRAELREVEPYVHCQFTHGKSSQRFGSSRNAWLSGTATWAYYSATQYIIGIRPTVDGLTIDPCIPAEWPGFTATRRFRGRTYRIAVSNPQHVCRGVKRMTVNGRSVEGNHIPHEAGGEDVVVSVTLG